MAVAALFGVRWEAPQARLGDAGVTQISNGNTGLGYSARTGVEAPLFGRFSTEAAYRCLNATADAAVGQHAGELGLIYGF